MSSMFLISVQDPTTRPSLSPWAWPAGAASYSPPSGTRLLKGSHPSHQRSDYDARKFVHPCLCCTRWWDSWPATCAAGQRQLPSCSRSRRQKRKEQPWNVLADFVGQHNALLLFEILLCCKFCCWWWNRWPPATGVSCALGAGWKEEDEDECWKEYAKCGCAAQKTRLLLRLVTKQSGWEMNFLQKMTGR